MKQVIIKTIYVSLRLLAQVIADDDHQEIVLNY